MPAAAAACFLLPEEGEISLGETGEQLRRRRGRLPLLAAIVGMAAESLINPYFIDGSLYVIRSLGCVLRRGHSRAEAGVGDAGGSPVLGRCNPCGNHIVRPRTSVPAKMAHRLLAGGLHGRRVCRQVPLDNVDSLVSDCRRIRRPGDAINPRVHRLLIAGRAVMVRRPSVLHRQ